MAKGKIYKIGWKNNWRSWTLNRIRERCPVNVKDATFVYLAGELDLDRAAAVRRGFCPDRMIAIERDKSLCEEQRKRGVNTIHGDVLDVLLAWPAHRPIHVLHADLEANLRKDYVEKFARAILSGAMASGAVVSVNIQRGMEYGEHKEYMDRLKECLLLGGLDQESVKNRARLFLAGVMYRIAENFFGPSIPKEAEEDLAEAVDKSIRPAFYQPYRSNRVVMDSCVFTVPKQGWYGAAAGSQVKRKISAALAIQTMRQNGTLPHSPRA